MTQNSDSACPHENYTIRASLDQARMDLTSIEVECLACGSKTHALDEAVALDDWVGP